MFVIFASVKKKKKAKKYVLLLKNTIFLPQNYTRIFSLRLSKGFLHTVMAGIKKKTKIAVVSDTCHYISSNVVKRRSLTHLF